jgi:hypothetical protein
MTEYDSTFKNVHVLFEKDDITHTMGEVVSAAGLKQIRIAETEKYPHVTFFFNGGREEPFEGEQRIMIPSPKVATYDLQPEMSAQGITDAIVPELKKAEEGVAAGRTKRNEARVAYQGAKLDVDNPSAARQLKRRLDQADLELKAAQEQLNKAKEDLKGLEEAKKSKEKVEMR